MSTDSTDGTDDTDSTDDGRSFEQLLEELEALTLQMSRGDIGIEEAADLYEQAERLHRLSADRLAQVQERIESLQPRLTE